MERLAKRFKQDFCVSRKRARTPEEPEMLKRGRLDYKNDWFLAIADNDLAEIQKLYNKDPSLMTVKTRKGIGTLSKAVVFCDRDTVRYLLARPEADVNMRDDKTGLTPLMIAAVMGRDKIVKELIRQPGIDLEIANARGKSVWTLAEETLLWSQTTKSRGRRHIIMGLLLLKD